MLRLLSPKTHGFLDYLIALFFFVGPHVTGFAQGRAATFSTMIGVAFLLLAIITRTPAGFFKTLPFSVHGAIELFIAVLLVILPWLAAFASGVKSRNYFLFMGLIVGMLWLVTDFRAGSKTRLQGTSD